MYINMVLKKCPTLEVKLYGFRFIAFCNASVNFTAVSNHVSGDTMRIHHLCFVFLRSFFRENLEFPGCLGTLADKALRCVLGVMMYFTDECREILTV